MILARWRLPLVDPGYLRRFGGRSVASGLPPTSDKGCAAITNAELGAGTLVILVVAGQPIFSSSARPFNDGPDLRNIPLVLLTCLADERWGFSQGFEGSQLDDQW
jgi:hypothetical protein